MPKIVTPLFQVGEWVYVLIPRSLSNINNLVKGIVIETYSDTITWSATVITYVIKTEKLVLSAFGNSHVQITPKDSYLSISGDIIKCSRDRVVPYTKVSEVLYGTKYSDF